MTAADQALASSSEIPLSLRGPAPTSVVVGYGFWLFLLSDIILFAALFAAYAVLSDATAGGPGGSLLFDKNRVLLETGCLLASSFTCGLGTLAVQREDSAATFRWMSITFLLGFIFLCLEVNEFAGLMRAGNGPTRSAFLSAFFTLVGTHGVHVAAGLLWLLVMMAQTFTLGFRPMVARRMFCFGLFWHALDIVWVGVFTIVYLGAR
jgi:cytochrome o ubiquinol oxidase subunit 3